MNPITAGRLCIMMFLQFFLWGSWYVAAYPVLSTMGFGGAEIGWTYSVGPIAGIISPFFVGMIADRFFSTERVLAVMHLVGGGAMLLAISIMGNTTPDPLVFGDTIIQLPKLSLTEAVASPVAINLLFFGHMLCYFPTLALTNSLALAKIEKPELVFPLIRVFGTLGWIIAGFFVSWQHWDSSISVFYLAAFTAILMGLYSFTLPHLPPPAAGKKITFAEVMGFEALVLFRRPPFLVFMVCSFLICIPLAFYYQMATKFITQGGLANPTFKMTYGQLSEVIFMLLMPLFFARLGVKWMLFVGMAAWVVRYALFALGAPDAVLWMLLSGIVLHGICYDFFFVTGQIYTDRIAPKEIRAQAQGLLVLCTLGLGMMIGAQLAGRIEVEFTPPETAALKAESGFIAHLKTSEQEKLDKALKEAEDSVVSEYKETTADMTDDAAKQDVTDLFKNAFAKASHPVNDEFNEKVDEATSGVQASIAKVDESIDELNAKPDAASDVTIQKEIHQKQLARLDYLQQKLDLVADEAAQFSEQRVDEEAQEATSEVKSLAIQKEKVDRLAAFSAYKSLQGDQAVNWQMIWTLPAIFAAVIMVIFALTFKDDKADVDPAEVGGDKEETLNE